MLDSTSAGCESPKKTIVETLAEQLGCDVNRVDAEIGDQGQQARPGLEPEKETLIEKQDDGQALVRFALPCGSIAQWKVDPLVASQTVAHAETILALHQARSERDQMQSEADALATQVVNDFEELSLIRSLAAAMELPDVGVTVGEMAIKSLRPLASGVGAASIAAVFLSEDGEELGPPCWSGTSLIDEDDLHRLIRDHQDEASVQPVVRNRCNELGSLRMPPALNEFVLLQCRSEGRLHGWLVACNRIEDDAVDVPWAQRGFTTVQASLLDTATHQLAAQVHNLRLLRQKEELYTDVVRALVNAVEARDPYTCGHSERVASFARCLGKAIGQSDVGCDRIYLTGLLHDVGKIAAPDGVLQKPGHLDDKERAIIETHTEAGWRILHELEALREVLPGVLYHHEHFDGEGYPDGLVGENIPLDGRILAVCDAFDAMTSDRPYREGMPIGKATEILRGGSGRYWDPRLIEAFTENMDAINRIRLEHKPRKHATRPAPVNGRPSTDPLPAADQQ